MAAITSLVVKTKTSSQTWSGSDNRVYFGIGPREWLLDNTNRDDFEKGHVDTFVLQNLAGLDDSDIRRIRLRKVGTDGWRPQWIKVYVNKPAATGAAFYEGDVGVWLDGGPGAQQKGGLQWEASDFPKRYVTSSSNVTKLVVRVTTANVANAQTDDAVFFSIGTREWSLDNLNKNDFERGNTDTFHLENLSGIKVADIRQIGLRKEGTNGWRPSRIRVWVNDDTPSPPFFDGEANIWLDGGSGAQNTDGLQWFSRDFPQPSPQPVENSVTALRVELETDDSGYAGTNDPIYFNIGTREWFLDNTNKNDFERGNTDTFVLGRLDDMGGLRRSDFRRIALRKYGRNGWRPKRIKVFLNNSSTPFYDGDIDVWLDGGSGAELKAGLHWEARDFTYEIPVYCHWVVGKDTSTIRPQRSKKASSELLANLNTEDYRQGAGSCDTYWTQGAITYRVVGFDTVKIDDADAQLLPDQTTADFTELRTIAANNNKANRLNVYFVRQTETGSNWFVPGSNPACWVKDTRNGATVNTTNNYRMVAVSTAHEIGHYFDLDHDGAKKFLMTGTGTNATSQLLRNAEVSTARSEAANLAE